jgi:hypothetical protein
VPLPQFILSTAYFQLTPVRSMNPEQLFMLSQYIETLIATLLEGKVTSFDELNETVVEKLLKLDTPFLD